MADTVEVLESQYDIVIEYLTSKKGFLEDPTMAPSEVADIEVLDHTQVIDAIKRLATSGPSYPEASLLAAYRDIHSVESEISIRNMTRSDYYVDAPINEADNVAKWTYSKITNGLRMRSDTSQGA
mgnify:CR=1 FL=1